MAENFVGVGTSNKTFNTFIAELLEKGVTIIADIRASPFSRFFPQYNQKNLAKALHENNISYEWLGNTLGNQKDESGKRTLTNFKIYTHSPKYKEGLETLTQMGNNNNHGFVGVLCACGKEDACHRNIVLQDLRK